MNLVKALRADRSIRLAVVGAGGKTSTLFQLARELTGPVFVSASTHFGSEQVKQGDRHLEIAPGESLLTRLESPTSGVTVVTGPLNPVDERTAGLTPAQLDELNHLAEKWGIPVLLEADGARSRSLKAPAEHEPAIPSWANTVLQVVGLSVLGKPLNEEYVHRPEQFSRLTGLAIGERISAAVILKYLKMPVGGLKNIPSTARRLVLLNQADTLVEVSGVEPIAQALLEEFDAVLIGSVGKSDSEHSILRVVNRVSGIILAGGGSERYGQPKQLLDFRGKPFIRQVAETAIASGLSPVVVVIGAVAEPIREALSGLPVQIVDNPDWQQGQSSSVRAGLRALPSETAGAVFLLSDQPQIPAKLIRLIVERYQQTFTPIVSPFIQGRRANPVLFDQSIFPDLMNLEGDTGGRVLFNRYPSEAIEWKDARLTLDVDTPEDYKRLLETTDEQ